MTTAAPNKPSLRLVPKPPGAIDADLVAFSVMEHIDVNFPSMWQTAAVEARSSIRNAVVRAVVAEASRSGGST